MRQVTALQPSKCWKAMNAPEDTTAHLLKGMVLAEDYITSNQDEKLGILQPIIEVHPEYPLARNNRGILNYQKGITKMRRKTILGFP